MGRSRSSSKRDDRFLQADDAVTCPRTKVWRFGIHVFIELHTTAQSGPLVLISLSYSNFPDSGEINDCCLDVYVFIDTVLTLLLCSPPASYTPLSTFWFLSC